MKGKNNGQENIFIGEDSFLNTAVFEKKPVANRVFSTDFLYIPFALYSYESVTANAGQTERLGFIRLERASRKRGFCPNIISLVKDWLSINSSI